MNFLKSLGIIVVGLLFAAMPFLALLVGFQQQSPGGVLISIIVAGVTVFACFGPGVSLIAHGWRSIHA